MAGMTTYFQKALLDHILNISTYSFPNPVYLSLHTSDPTDSGSHTNEILVASGYTRQTLAAKMGATDSSSGISFNTSTITFGPASSGWGTIGYLGVEDGTTSSSPDLNHMLMSGAASTARTINTGGSFTLTASQLAIQFD